VADDARYGIYTFVTSSPKPRELTIREELKALAEQGDLTSALIRGLQFNAEEEYRATPRPIRSVGLLPNKLCVQNFSQRV
jgi:hypothetical protein